MPLLPAAGVPLRTPVVALKLTPLGSVPNSFQVGAGKPVSVRLKLPAEPTVNAALLALVMAGACLMVSVKFCVAELPTPLLAVKTRLYVPPVPVAGVPLRTPVLVLKVTPLGSVPDSLSVGVGEPVAVTVNVPADPAVNAALFALVMLGAWFVLGVALRIRTKSLSMPELLAVGVL